MSTRILSEIQKSGLGIEKVADVIGVHPNTIRSWEHGRYEPNGRNLIQLCALFGCSPEYLLNLTDERVPKGTD